MISLPYNSATIATVAGSFAPQGFSGSLQLPLKAEYRIRRFSGEDICDIVILYERIQENNQKTIKKYRIKSIRY